MNVSLLAEPIHLDGQLVGHTFDNDILIPIPVDEETLSRHPTVFAHWYALWRKAETWAARLESEAKKRLELEIARIAGNAAGAAAMAEGVAVRTGGKSPKVKPMPKWQVEMQARDSDAYLDKMKELAKAKETAAKLEGFVKSLEHRDRRLTDMVLLQTGGRR